MRVITFQSHKPGFTGLKPSRSAQKNQPALSFSASKSSAIKQASRQWFQNDGLPLAQRIKAFANPAHLKAGTAEMKRSLKEKIFIDSNQKRKVGPFGLILGALELFNVVIDLKLSLLTLGLLPLIGVLNPYRWQPFCSETARAFLRGVKKSAGAFK